MLPNVELFTSTQTTALLGDGTRLTGIRVKDRKTEEERDITLDGIFVQIGLMPNSDVVSGQVELSPRKEIIIDATNRTNVSGVYAAGDVTTVPYKQITIAMGEGAKAALSAFDDRVRGGYSIRKGEPFSVVQTRGRRCVYPSLWLFVIKRML